MSRSHVARSLSRIFNFSGMQGLSAGPLIKDGSVDRSHYLLYATRLEEIESAVDAATESLEMTKASKAIYGPIQEFLESGNHPEMMASDVLSAGHDFLAVLDDRSSLASAFRSDLASSIGLQEKIEIMIGHAEHCLDTFAGNDNVNGKFSKEQSIAIDDLIRISQDCMQGIQSHIHASRTMLQTFRLEIPVLKDLLKKRFGLSEPVRMAFYAMDPPRLCREDDADGFILIHAADAKAAIGPQWHPKAGKIFDEEIVGFLQIASSGVKPVFDDDLGGRIPLSISRGQKMNYRRHGLAVSCHDSGFIIEDGNGNELFRDEACMSMREAADHSMKKVDEITAEQSEQPHRM